MAGYDYKTIDQRWQAEWKRRGLFEPKIDTAKKKFLITVPIPYPSGSMHLGHMYTWTRADIYARFMRMRGYNVLFPQGFHFTGGPIIGISEKLKEKDPKTVSSFINQGVSEADLGRFGKEPRALAEYFAASFKNDFDAIGMSIDWSRNFITTSLNPQYSKFIDWQFTKLRNMGLVSEGTHPVVWCPKEKTPLGDHDRAVGEGEYPVRFTLIKFRAKNYVFPAATLRPETIFGVTNLWINPLGKYAVFDVDGEKWIVSKDCGEKLRNQFKDAKHVKDVAIKEFVDEEAVNPLTKHKVRILDADFVETGVGTGVVMSVPMHAPFDYEALRRLKEAKPQHYGHIIPKKVIDVPGENDLVENAIARFGRGLYDLKEATKLVYKKEGVSGVMNENAGGLKGMAVKDAVGAVTMELESAKACAELYDLSGQVICRCGTAGVVKVLEKQWFIRYSDEEWKTRARKLVERLVLYPEDIRLQLINTLDWLDDKAAARMGGLGTPLPWDRDWVIEPLSDSTIYMAYYTIADLILGIKPEALTEGFFDYVFLDSAKKPENAPENIDEFKKAFRYWYPLDMRVSAKELLQNHFVFFIMNHSAIFREDNWPRGIQINGWLTVEGEKLSKSKGATLTIRQGLSKYGADELRMIAAAGNGMDDVEWDPHTIEAFDQRILFVLDAAQKAKGKVSKNRLIDDYAKSMATSIIKETTDDMSSFKYGMAMTHSFFEFYNLIKFYKDFGGSNASTMRWLLSTFCKLNHPFFPHVTEEINAVLGGADILEGSAWPTVEGEQDFVLENEFEMLENTEADIRNVIKITGKKPTSIKIGIADAGKFEVYNKVVDAAKTTKNIAEIRKTLRMNDKLLDKLLRDPSKIPERKLDHKVEVLVLSEATGYLGRTFDCKISVESDKKEGKAMPGRPAIELI